MPWTPGEAAAQKRLETFLENAAGYASERDRPDREGTSKLSPHLRFGEISPRQVWHAARFAAAEHPRLAADIDTFIELLGDAHGAAGTHAQWNVTRKTTGSHSTI